MVMPSIDRKKHIGVKDGLRIANIHAYNERYEENEPVRILSFNGGHSYSPIDLTKALRPSATTLTTRT